MTATTSFTGGSIGSPNCRSERPECFEAPEVCPAQGGGRAGGRAHFDVRKPARTAANAAMGASRAPRGRSGVRLTVPPAALGSVHLDARPPPPRGDPSGCPQRRPGCDARRAPRNRHARRRRRSGGSVPVGFRGWRACAGGCSRLSARRPAGPRGRRQRPRPSGQARGGGADPDNRPA